MAGDAADTDAPAPTCSRPTTGRGRSIPPVRDAEHPRRRRGRSVSRDRPLATCRTAELFGAEARRVPGRRRSGPTARPWDLIIFEGTLPATPAARRRSWRSRRRRRARSARSSARSKNPGIATLGTDEPILRYVDLSTTHIAAAQQLDAARLGADGHPRPEGRSPALLRRPGRPADRRPRLRAAPVRPAAPGRLPDPAREPDRRAARRLAPRRRPRSQPGDPVDPDRPDGRDRAPRRRARRTGRRPGARRRRRPDRHLHPDRPARRLRRDADRRSPAPRASPGARGRPRRADAAAGRRPAAAAPRRAGAALGHGADPTAPIRFAVDLFDVDESAIAPGPDRVLEELGRRAGRAGASGRPARPAGRQRGRPTAAPPERPRRAVDPDRPARPASRCASSGSLYHRDAVLPGVARPRRAPVRRGRIGARPDGHRRSTPRRRCCCSIPALAPDGRPASRRRGAARARPAARWRSSSAASCWPALVLALAGFRLVLPVDRLATVFVVDLSDSVGTAGREDALAWLRDSLEVMPEGDVAGIVGFGRAALVERLPAGGPRDRPDRDHAGPLRDRHRGGAAPGVGALPRRRPEADRAALGRQRHDRLRPERGGARRRPRRSRSRRGRSGSGRPTRSSSSG